MGRTHVQTWRWAPKKRSSLTIDTVRDFHQRMYRTSCATLIACGDLGVDDFRQIAADTFGSWSENIPGVPDDAAVAAPPMARPWHGACRQARRHRRRFVSAKLASQRDAGLHADRAEHDSGWTIDEPHRHEAAAGEGPHLGARTAFDLRRGRVRSCCERYRESDGTERPCRRLYLRSMRSGPTASDDRRGGGGEGGADRGYAQN